MDAAERWLVVACVMIALLIAAIFYPAMVRAHDHDHPELDGWYAGLMMPDLPTSSCCGKADAYWCDDYYARDGKAYCKITDDRDDKPLGRPHVPVGTEIEIPDYKLKFDRGNPTGHSVVFLSSSLFVYCFVQGTLI